MRPAIAFFGTWVNGIRISHRIMFAFAAVLACTLGLGTFAIQSLIAVDRSAEDIRAHWLPQTRSLGDLLFQAQRYRVIEAAYVMAEPAGRAAEAKTLEQIHAHIDADIAEQVKLAQSSEEQAGLATLASLWRDYFRLDQQLLEIAEKQGAADASKFYRTDMREAIHKFQDRLNQQVASNIKGGNLSADRGEAVGAAGLRQILSTMALAALLCIAVGYFLWRGVARPVTQLTAAMTALAKGEKSVAIPALELRNEIGDMARSAAFFRDDSLARRESLEAEAALQRGAAESEREQAAAARARTLTDLRGAMDKLGEALRRLAHGELDFQLPADFSSEFSSVRDDFNGAVDKLRETLKAVVSCADSIQSGTREISKASDDLSLRTEQQAASLEQTSTSLEQITGAVRKTAEATQHARSVVAAANEDAHTSARVVREAISAMDEISTSANHISQIIGVIDEIAFQTNLLALNAGVEAARAGESGRGFAVVASEVRALAMRSGSAAKEIKTLISASGAQVENGVKLVGETGAALERIVGEVSSVSQIVSEIAQGAREQAIGLEEVSAAISAMDQVTQQNAAMVEESTAATQTLSRETAELAGLVGQFQFSHDSRNDSALRRDLMKAAPHAFKSATAPVRPAASAAKPARPALASARKTPAAPPPPPPASAPAPRKAAAGSADDWTEF